MFLLFLCCWFDLRATSGAFPYLQSHVYCHLLILVPWQRFPGCCLHCAALALRSGTAKANATYTDKNSLKPPRVTYHISGQMVD